MNEDMKNYDGHYEVNGKFIFLMDNKELGKTFKYFKNKGKLMRLVAQIKSICNFIL